LLGAGVGDEDDAGDGEVVFGALAAVAAFPFFEPEGAFEANGVAFVEVTVEGFGFLFPGFAVHVEGGGGAIRGVGVDGHGTGGDGFAGGGVGDLGVAS
jgi:hypothetical protein